MTAPGKLLVFEGMDGSGKTTLSRAVTDVLARHQMTCWDTFPNVCNPVGELIRSTFKGEAKISKEAMLWLFTAEAVDQDPRLRYWLEQGRIVILDRHTLCSAQVYQTEVHSAAVVQAVQSSWPHFVPPDFLFIVDVPVETALRRAQQRSKPVDLMFESNDEQQFRAMLESRRQKYLKLQWPGYQTRQRYILDGTRTIEQLVHQVLTVTNLPTKLAPAPH